MRRWNASCSPHVGSRISTNLRWRSSILSKAGTIRIAAIPRSETPRQPGTNGGIKLGPSSSLPNPHLVTDSVTEHVTICGHKHLGRSSLHAQPVLIGTYRDGMVSFKTAGKATPWYRKADLVRFWSLEPEPRGLRCFERFGDDQVVALEVDVFRPSQREQLAGVIRYRRKRDSMLEPPSKAVVFLVTLGLRAAVGLARSHPPVISPAPLPQRSAVRSGSLYCRDIGRRF